ncbi:MAG: hypothetical protein K2Y56_05580 [Methylobacterium sp.]|uniref:hypothetical protein n=1 Tax=Methylobacterium sp. TaxID=409 RepID=UPI0025CFD222|nr:hypothetical protein [Methylobacterium sp.]MBX9930993.1 hypothetical protein [Methylobacterium sp.]
MSNPGDTKTAFRGGSRERRERRARAAAIALTGLLGIAWVVMVVGRYPELLPS